MTDAALVVSQMQSQQGFRKLADERVEMVNGQVLTIRTAEPRTFAGGMQRESRGGTGLHAPRRQARREHRPEAQPAAHVRGRLGGRVARPDRQHRADVPPHQGHRPPRDGPAGDVDRRPRGLHDPPRPDREELAAGPDPARSPAASTRGSWTRRADGWAPRSVRRPAPRSSSSSMPRPSAAAGRRRPRTTPARAGPRSRTSRDDAEDDADVDPPVRAPKDQEVDPGARPRFRDRPRQLATRRHRRSPFPAQEDASERRGDCSPTDLARRRGTGYNGSSGPCCDPWLRLLDDASKPSRPRGCRLSPSLDHPDHRRPLLRAGGPVRHEPAELHRSLLVLRGRDADPARPQRSTTSGTACSARRS